jgi:hypothetical protein
VPMPSGRVLFYVCMIKCGGADNLCGHLWHAPSVYSREPCDYFMRRLANQVCQQQAAVVVGLATAKSKSSSQGTSSGGARMATGQLPLRRMRINWTGTTCYVECCHSGCVRSRHQTDCETVGTYWQSRWLPLRYASLPQPSH